MISAYSKESLYKSLPIEDIALGLMYTIENNQTTIVVGETGSGKSTKIPEFLYKVADGRYIQNNKMIALTLPKWVSVLNISSRIAFNLNCNLGEEVGYSIRFDSKFNPGITKIKILTDGMLVREMLLDPLLSWYSVIIVDDCHERSMYTDIILGLLKKIRNKWEDLKIIISSATIDAELYYKFFNDPPRFPADIIGKILINYVEIKVIYIYRGIRKMLSSWYILFR